MPEPLVILPNEDDTARALGYRVGKWRGYDNYECIYCQYSTLWIAKIKKHIEEGDHPWAFPGQYPEGIGTVSEEGPEY